MVKSVHGTDLDCRDLFNFDVFSGQSAISKSFRQAGLKSDDFDKELRDVQNDITTVLGFYRAILGILRVKEDGLVTMGPPCSSFTFLNRPTSGRSASRPLGFQSKLYIKQANLITARALLLCLLATARAVYVFVEQPAGSIMTAFPYMVWMQNIISRYVIRWQNQFYWLGHWGATSCKPSRCFGTVPWAADLYKRMTKQFRKSLSSSGISVVYFNQKGKKVVRGGPLLKSTQVYPMEFGKRICTLHRLLMEKKACVLKAHLKAAAKKLQKNGVKHPPYAWKHVGLGQLRWFLKEVECTEFLKSAPPRQLCLT